MSGATRKRKRSASVTYAWSGPADDKGADAANAWDTQHHDPLTVLQNLWQEVPTRRLADMPELWFQGKSQPSPSQVPTHMTHKTHGLTTTASELWTKLHKAIPVDHDEFLEPTRTRRGAESTTPPASSRRCHFFVVDQLYNL